MNENTVPIRATDIRERNEKLVLRRIQAAGKAGTSQSEIVLETGLKAPTVYRIFTRLESLSLIEPTAAKTDEKKKTEKKGRKPAAFRVKKGELFIIGVEFWAESLSLGVFDLNGDELYSRVLTDIGTGKNADEFIVLIVTAIKKAMKVLELDKDKIIGIGVGAPGQVNIEKREVSFYSRIQGMINYPIAEKLESKLGIPVTLHNNCSVLALSEFRHEEFDDKKSLFMFLLRSGVNGAFVHSGKVYVTSQNTTIETGHISIAVDGLPCTCGAKGCLEAYMNTLETASGNNWLFASMADSLASGAQPNAKESVILNKAADYLAAAVQTVSRVFRPQSFLIVAFSREIAERIAQLVGERIRKAPSQFDYGTPPFIARAYIPELAQRGSADLVLDTFFN